MKISELYTYPVKSLAGIRLETADLIKTGIRHDRQWMVVETDGYLALIEHLAFNLDIFSSDEGSTGTETIEVVSRGMIRSKVSRSQPAKMAIFPVAAR